MRAKSRPGDRHFNITLLSLASDCVTKRLYWIYRCDCGETSRVETRKLRSKKKCPVCAHKDQTDKITRHGHAKDKQRSSLYDVWLSMKQRCFNTNHSSYRDYGARGITVCERWLNFENFCADLPVKPASGYQLNRIDNNKGYEPGNVNWVSPKKNCNNRRSSIFLTWNNKTMTLAEWALEIDLPYTALKQRRAKGWSVEKMLTTPWVERNKRRAVF